MRPRRLRRIVSAGIASAFGIAVGAMAQEGPALRGRVTDGNGSALPGVTVEARVPGRPAVPVTSTDRQGSWRIDGLPAGSYSVSFRLPGFASVSREKVSVGEAVTSLDVALHLSVNADVLVTGKRTFRNLADVENPTDSLLGVANAATDGAITARQIDERPILRPAEVLETVTPA